MESRRRVSFSSIINKDGEVIEGRGPENLKGYFHRWGEMSPSKRYGEKVETKRWTVGIVESDNGNIYAVLPSSLKFIEEKSLI